MSVRHLLVSGRYVDRCERRDGDWKIAYRSERVDWIRDEPAADACCKGGAMISGARKPADSLYDREAMRKRYEG